ANGGGRTRHQGGQTAERLEPAASRVRGRCRSCRGGESRERRACPELGPRGDAADRGGTGPAARSGTDRSRRRTAGVAERVHVSASLPVPGWPRADDLRQAPPPVGGPAARFGASPGRAAPEGVARRVAAGRAGTGPAADCGARADRVRTGAARGPSPGGHGGSGSADGPGSRGRDAALRGPGLPAGASPHGRRPCHQRPPARCRTAPGCRSAPGRGATASRSTRGQLGTS
ncbi:MAG: hypothetical protein QOJ83_1778, partial [Frankiales bacterium]|nr:hypothetical protein [Frankiales bacterium]